MEAIILAGGFGTRLKSVISDVPKPMADISGKPFLEYLLGGISGSGINRVILSVGYKSDLILKYFGNSFNGLKIVYALEEEPLGTGGALVQSLKYAKASDVFLFNGDTLFTVNLQQLYQAHLNKGNDVTMALKPMTDFDRYGAVTTVDGLVRAFEEKQYKATGLINGGVYVLKASLLKVMPLTEKFSFETDFLEKQVQNLKIGAYVSTDYFIDIGIPEDYLRAQRELSCILQRSNRFDNI